MLIKDRAAIVEFSEHGGGLPPDRVMPYKIVVAKRGKMVFGDPPPVFIIVIDEPTGVALHARPSRAASPVRVLLCSERGENA